VTLEQLAALLIAAGREALADTESRYELIAYDWSHLDYSDHGSKKDRTRGKLTRLRPPPSEHQKRGLSCYRARAEQS